MLERHDVGHRVVIRRRVGVGPRGRPVLSDLLGQLVAFAEDHILVRDDAGTEQIVPHDIVVAAKRIPPRPARFSEIAALERVADEAWPAPVHERLGEWFLRAAAGWTSRANSALPLGAAGLPLDQAIDACAAWYRGHGLTPQIAVPLPLRRDVRDELTRMGWYGQPPVLVQTARLADVLGAGSPAPAEPAGVRDGVHVELAERPSPDFLRVVAARKRGLPEVARHVLSGGPAVRFAELRAAPQVTPAQATPPHDSALPEIGPHDTAPHAAEPQEHPPVRAGGPPLAVARGVVVGEWLHISLVEVVEAARRRGLARRATRELARWATRLGASGALLQVEEDNAAAVSLYRRLGFHTHHRYVTFAQPSS
jgi:GNAT superfamily N-acetyltransferase